MRQIYNHESSFKFINSANNIEKCLDMNRFACSLDISFVHMQTEHILYCKCVPLVSTQIVTTRKPADISFNGVLNR